MRTVQFWEAPFGTFELPSDMPPYKWRKNGWFDHRRSMTPKAEAYIKDMEARMEEDWKAGRDLRKFKPLTWKKWLENR